ncbi:MAG: response regulator transcription factor [Muribaculaceae bacterium]|nr:response regulator transcription factor [Muribaculaceae bacterium]
MKTRVLIIEPSEVIVEGLSSLLGAQTRFKVLPPLYGLEGLAERLVTGKPDVIVLNPTLSSQPAQLLGDHPTPVVALVYQYVEPLVLKRYDSVIDIRDARGTIADTLVKAAQSTEHETSDSSGSYELSKRETDVLVQVARGMTNKEIADALNVSIHTVISHRKNIMHKTGIKSVAGLTVYAILHNLIDEV